MKILAVLNHDGESLDYNFFWIENDEQIDTLREKYKEYRAEFQKKKKAYMKENLGSDFGYARKLGWMWDFERFLQEHLKEVTEKDLTVINLEYENR